MKKLHPIALLLFLVIASACSSDNSSTIESELVSSDSSVSNAIRLEALAVDAITIPEKVYFGETYDITVTYTLPNTCYSYNSLLQEEESQNRIKLKVIAHLDEDSDCAEVLTVQQQTFSFNVTQKEDYIVLLFKKTNESGEDVFQEKRIPVLVRK